MSTSMTRVEPPRLYLNGFPKAGLHLAERMAVAMYQPVKPEWNWFGTNAWTIKRHNLEQAALALGAIEPGMFLKGHMGYLKALEALFCGLKIGMVFIYRDLRDVVVSQTYHILSDKKDKLFHTGREQYLKLGSKENIMIAVIEGIDGYPGIFERFESFAPWLDREWALKMPYEEMLLKPERAAKRFFEYSVSLSANGNETYVDKRVRKAAIDGILLEMKQRQLSPTYRKGKRGQWKYEFTPRVTACFKEHDPGYLARLGYEKDGNW